MTLYKRLKEEVYNYLHESSTPKHEYCIQLLKNNTDAYQLPIVFIHLMIGITGLDINADNFESVLFRPRMAKIVNLSSKLKNN